MASPHLTAGHLDAYQAEAAQIERLFTAGKISPVARRSLLAEARDRVGISAVKLPQDYQPPRAALLTEDEARARKRGADKRPRHDQTRPQPTL